MALLLRKEVVALGVVVGVKIQEESYKLSPLLAGKLGIEHGLLPGVGQGCLHRHLHLPSGRAQLPLPFFIRGHDQANPHPCQVATSLEAAELAALPRLGPDDAVTRSLTQEDLVMLGLHCSAEEAPTAVASAAAVVLVADQFPVHADRTPPKSYRRSPPCTPRLLIFSHLFRGFV